MNTIKKSLVVSAFLSTLVIAGLSGRKQLSSDFTQGVSIVMTAHGVSFDESLMSCMRLGDSDVKTWMLHLKDQNNAVVWDGSAWRLLVEPEMQKALDNSLASEIAANRSLAKVFDSFLWASTDLDAEASEKRRENLPEDLQDILFSLDDALRKKRKDAANEQIFRPSGGVYDLSNLSPEAAGRLSQPVAAEVQLSEDERRAIIDDAIVRHAKSDHYDLKRRAFKMSEENLAEGSEAGLGGRVNLPLKNDDTGQKVADVFASLGPLNSEKCPELVVQESGEDPQKKRIVFSDSSDENAYRLSAQYFNKEGVGQGSITQEHGSGVKGMGLVRSFGGSEPEVIDLDKVPAGGLGGRFIGQQAQSEEFHKPE